MNSTWMTDEYILLNIKIKVLKNHILAAKKVMHSFIFILYCTNNGNYDIHIKVGCHVIRFKTIKT